MQQGIERGMQQGIERGMQQGIEQNRAQIAALAEKMRAQSREGELVAALSDAAMLDALLKEFEIE